MLQTDLPLDYQEEKVYYKFFDIRIHRKDSRINNEKYFKDKGIDVGNLLDKDNKNWIAKHSLTEFIYFNTEKRIEVKITNKDKIHFIAYYPYNDKGNIFYEIMQDTDMKKFLTTMISNKADFEEHIDKWWLN